ncbi:MAG TPA: hypothetical protein VM283_01110, partial [Armatimonadota bacterium]|nr:hypothetical protein [Armatimonadota bacterium]
ARRYAPGELWLGLLRYGLLVALLLIGYGAVTTARAGWGATWSVPDLRATFLQIQALTLLAAAGAIAVALPWPCALAALLIRRHVRPATKPTEDHHAHRH